MLTLEGRIREMVHRFKYGGRPQLAGPLIRLCPWLEGQLGPEPVIVPVPLHRSRRHQRGYNQAELLARFVATLAGGRCLSGLVRVRDTPAQVGRSGRERRQALRDSFSWRSDPLSGPVHVLDDVITTGATALAATAALKRAGADRVDVLGLALG